MFRKSRTGAFCSAADIIARNQSQSTDASEDKDNKDSDEEEGGLNIVGKRGKVHKGTTTTFTTSVSPPPHPTAASAATAGNQASTNLLGACGTSSASPLPSSALASHSASAAASTAAAAVGISGTPQWLSDYLRAQNMSPHWIQLCEVRIVIQESAQIFAHTPTAEMTAPYLDRLGITGKGIQHMLIWLHGALRGEDGTDDVQTVLGGGVTRGRPVSAHMEVQAGGSAASASASNNVSAAHITGAAVLGTGVAAADGGGGGD